MRICLFKTGACPFNEFGLPYGPLESNADVEVWHFPRDIVDWIFAGGYDILMPWLLEINEACGTDLDLGEPDYFDAEACKILLKAIDCVPALRTSAMPVALIAKFKELANRGVELGYGILVVI
jgi:hypothetical protein